MVVWVGGWTCREGRGESERVLVWIDGSVDASVLFNAMHRHHTTRDVGGRRHPGPEWV